MQNLVDMHTHTVVSGHAYTTLLENVNEAANKGLKILGSSDHGPNMPGGPHIFYFANFRVVPRNINGVTILKGCEANIMDIDGKIDIPVKIQRELDYIIASLHDVCIKPGTKEENTAALVSAMENPNVCVMGHIGNPKFPIYYEEVVKKAKEKDILIEINNSSMSGSRVGSEKNCIEVARLCKKHGVKILLGTDSHISYQIGVFDKAEKVIKEAGVPSELIMNNDEHKIIEFLKSKGKLKDLK